MNSPARRGLNSTAYTWDRFSVVAELNSFDAVWYDRNGAGWIRYTCPHPFLLRKSMPTLNRREFVWASSLALGSAPFGTAAGEQPSTKTYRACVIGHTGRGSYGHSL